MSCFWCLKFLSVPSISGKFVHLYTRSYGECNKFSLKPDILFLKSWILYYLSSTNWSSKTVFSYQLSEIFFYEFLIFTFTRTFTHTITFIFNFTATLLCLPLPQIQIYCSAFYSQEPSVCVLSLALNARLLTYTVNE